MNGTVRSTLIAFTVLVLAPPAAIHAAGKSAPTATSHNWGTEIHRMWESEILPHWPCTTILV